MNLSSCFYQLAEAENLRWKPNQRTRLPDVSRLLTTSRNNEPACVCRSIREDPPDAKRQKAEEEEDNNQEEHPEPLLQRVVQL